MDTKLPKSPKCSSPASDPEVEQYYQWSEHPTSLQYDRIGDQFVNIGSFPFYQQTPHLPTCKIPSNPKAIECNQEAE